MEYIQDRGIFSDVPFEKILSTFKKMYKADYIKGAGGDFLREASQRN